MKRSLEHRHVRIMEESGINMSRIILVIPTMELEDSSRDLERIYLGSQLLKPICNHMMNHIGTLHCCVQYGSRNNYNVGVPGIL